MPLSYNKLDPSTNQIRLLTILPDENDDNIIRASLHIKSLNNACDFEALSYVWGDTSVTVDISVDDCIVGVTPNLHAFLRGLRQPNTERTVWVDYVCINQNDISERNSQVPLMCQIYSTARSVVVWLGDLTPDAMEIIAWYRANRDGLYFESTNLSILDAVCRLLECASALCSAPYWHRVWTFQEWHLSRNAPVCMHEKTAFTIGNMFDRLYEELNVARSRINARISLGIPSRAKSVDPNKVEDPTMLFIILQQKLDKILNAIPRDILSLGGRAPRSSGLGDLLLLTVDRQCSNKVDRVYALYGLSPVARATYPPDYRKTISQVNHETALFTLQHEANMEIFNDFDFCFNSVNKDESLPSWVVDFTTTDAEHRAKMQQSFSKTLHLDKALWEKTRDQNPMITDDMQTLKLWCRTIGFSVVPYLLDYSAVEYIMEQLLFEEPDREHDTILKAICYYTGCSKIIPADLFCEMMTYSVSGVEAWRATPRGYHTALNRSFEKLIGHRYFPIATSAGMSLGFTDCAIRKGDRLVIPCGIAQVFVLRPIPEELLVDGEEVQCFKVIGRAYVEGISNREEASPDPLRTEMEKTPPTHFCLR
ncbi:hypothetical protein AtubIFM57258_003224 [Aspergillus tubingensis]|nr:hypothetical protein AtubIFM57258_003224 [Aspergillus tubingensis]